MTTFTYLCPRARPDEAGAHDITDAMSKSPDAYPDDRVLFCRRCGQAVPLADAVDATQRDPDAADGQP